MNSLSEISPTPAAGVVHREELPDTGFRGNAVPFVVLLVAWTGVFHFLGNSTFGYIDTASIFGWMHNAYNVANSDDSHGNLIPFVVVGLLWQSRKKLMTLPTRPWLPGLLFLAGAAILHVVGYAVQQPRVSIIAYFAGAYSLVGTCLGPKWMRSIFFPFVLFGFSIPMGNMVEAITMPLRQMATSITFFVVVTVLGLPVARQGTQLIDLEGGFNYEVAAACSGLRSMIPLLAISSIYAMTSLKKPFNRFLVISSSFPLAVTFNVLRLITIIICARAFGKSAGDFVHEWFGFFTYAAALVFIIGLGGWLERAPKIKPGKLEGVS